MVGERSRGLDEKGDFGATSLCGLVLLRNVELGRGETSRLLRLLSQLDLGDRDPSWDADRSRSLARLGRSVARTDSRNCGVLAGTSLGPPRRPLCSEDASCSSPLSFESFEE